MSLDRLLDATVRTCSAVGLGAVATGPIALAVVAGSDADPPVATAVVVGPTLVVAAFASVVLGDRTASSARRRLARGVAAVSTAYVGLAVAFSAGGVSRLAVPLGATGAVGVGGAVAGHRLAATLAARRALSEAETVLRVRARRADRPGWWVRLLGIAGGCVTAVLGVALVAVGNPLVGGVVAASCSVGTAWVYRTGRPRSIAVTRSGIVAGRRLRRWDRLRSYETDGTTIVVRGEGALGDVRIDAEDLETPDEVLQALSEHLPRVE